MFKEGDVCVIENDKREFLNGKEFTIEGTAKEIWNIDDVWMSEKGLRIPALLDYVMNNRINMETIYYGKVGLFGKVIAQSKLKKITKENPEKKTEAKSEKDKKDETKVKKRKEKKVGKKRKREDDDEENKKENPSKKRKLEEATETKKQLKV
jgi:hypothetical protein